MDKIVRTSIADLLINISAGWFGLSFGAPFLAGPTLFDKIRLLTTDIGFGILFLFPLSRIPRLKRSGGRGSLLVAIWLRRRKKR